MYKPLTFNFAPNGTLEIQTAVRANLIAFGYLAHLITFQTMTRALGLEYTQ